MKKFLTFILGISLSFGGNAEAEEVFKINLQDAINLALKNNRTIEQAAEDREIARWNLSAVRRSYGPKINWSSSWNKIGGRYYGDSRSNRKMIDAMSEEERQIFFAQNNRRYSDFPSYKSENYNSINLQMPIYTGGRLESQKKSAKYNLNYSDLLLENSRQEIKWNTSEAYFQVLQDIDLMKVRQEELNYLYEHLRTVQIQYEVGTVAMSDVLATNVQIANSQHSLNATRASYENAVSTLNNILGLPVDTHLVVEEHLDFTPYKESEEFCLNYALNHRPDGIAANYAVKSSEEMINTAKSEMRPNISAVASGTFSGEGAFKADHDAERWAAGVQLNWSLFDNNVTSAQVKRAKSALKKAESQAKQQSEKIRLEVHNAYTNLKIAEQNIEINSNAVKQAEEQCIIAKVRYEEGVDTNLNFMNASEKLTQAKTNYFYAIYAYHTSWAQLEKAMGVPIEIDASLYNEAVENGKKSEKALEIARIGD